MKTRFAPLKSLWLLLLIFTSTIPSRAQHLCGTVGYTHALHGKNVNEEDDRGFDNVPRNSDGLYLLYTDAEDPDDFFITFNLDRRQTVAYALVDITGRQIVYKELHDVLNQTFKFEPGYLRRGIYVVRLLIDKRYHACKVIAGQ